MDYSKLNSFLNDLEVDNIKPNNDFNYQIYNETQRFANKDSTESNTNLNKQKTKHTYENLSINRNNEIVELNGMNRHFNFERINPQRDTKTNEKLLSNNSSNNSNNTSFSLNRQLQTKDLTNQRVVNIFDNTQFSEDYKSYRDFKQHGLDDNNTINDKLSNRDMIPSLSTAPKKMWD
jgi:hypothetical protein